MPFNNQPGNGGIIDDTCSNSLHPKERQMGTRRCEAGQTSRLER